MSMPTMDEATTLNSSSESPVLMPLPQPAQRTVAVVKAGQIWRDKLGYFFIKAVTKTAIIYWEIPSLKVGWTESEFMLHTELVSDCISEEGVVQNGR